MGVKGCARRTRDGLHSSSLEAVWHGSTCDDFAGGASTPELGGGSSYSSCLRRGARLSFLGVEVETSCLSVDGVLAVSSQGGKPLRRDLFDAV